MEITRSQNLRNLSVAPGAGTDVVDTQMLKGEGKLDKAQTETNEMKEYTTGAAPSPGKLGGMPSHQ